VWGQFREQDNKEKDLAANKENANRGPIRPIITIDSVKSKVLERIEESKYE
jgi:hypothetical protein